MYNALRGFDKGQKTRIQSDRVSLESRCRIGTGIADLDNNDLPCSIVLAVLDLVLS